ARAESYENWGTSSMPIEICARPLQRCWVGRGLRMAQKKTPLRERGYSQLRVPRVSALLATARETQAGQCRSDQQQRRRCGTAIDGSQVARARPIGAQSEYEPVGDRI